MSVHAPGINTLRVHKLEKFGLIYLPWADVADEIVIGNVMAQSILTSKFDSAEKCNHRTDWMIQPSVKIK